MFRPFIYQIIHLPYQQYFTRAYRTKSLSCLFFIKSTFNFVFAFGIWPIGLRLQPNVKMQLRSSFTGGWKCAYCFWNLGTRQKIIRFYSCIFPLKTHLVADINWKLLSRTYWCGLVAESHLTWAEMVFCFQNCSDLLSEKYCSSD